MKEQIQERIDTLEAELLNLKDSDFKDASAVLIHIQELRQQIQLYKFLLTLESDDTQEN